MTPEKIRNGLKEMAKNHGPAVSNIAQVKSVNIEEQTCVLVDEDQLETFDVRLRPVLNGNKSILIVPKVGSYVLAVRVEDDDDWMVIGYDEIEEMSCDLNGIEIAFKDKIHLKVNDNNVADLFNDLFVAINNMVFTTPDGNTTSLVNAVEFQQLQQKFAEVFE